MKTKIQIMSTLGELLFEFEKENNTVKDTLLEASKNHEYLIDADLNGVDLRNADLRGANLDGALDVPFVPSYLPEGEFIAWKKLSDDLIVKLKILADSKRSRSTGDKCRCDKALVLEFQNIDGSKSEETTFTNCTHTKCIYTVGQVVYADKWDDNRWNECSYGIHFFIDRQSAVNY